VLPADFVPLLEETGLIVPVGEWVMQSASRQARRWRDAGLKPVTMAVNLSARQFLDQHLERTVKRILGGAGIDAKLMQIEITESMLIGDPDKAARILRALAETGLQISVDDFGTGYSSLAYLKRFPLDALKIDRSFVRDIVRNGDDAAIAVAVIDLGHALQLEVVAEGVETRAQLDFLARHGCDEIQGFYFSPPVDEAQCEAILRQGAPVRAAGS
jgi:EAL domain-containing protein (putative c-di-GMP-specific phosphodiesterase class I)